jgi:hypothetical protein
MHRSGIVHHCMIEIKSLLQPQTPFFVITSTPASYFTWSSDRQQKQTMQSNCNQPLQMSFSDLEPWPPDQFRFTKSLTNLKFSTTLEKALCSMTSLFLSTPIRTVLHYNPKVTQLARKFPACYKSSGFITKGTRSPLVPILIRRIRHGSHQPTQDPF